MSEDLAKRVEELEKLVRQKRNAAQAGLFVSVIIVLIASAYLFMDHQNSPKATETQMVVSSDSIRNLGYTIDEQTKEIEEQSMRIKALEAQLDSMMNDSTTAETPTDVGAKKQAAVEEKEAPQPEASIASSAAGTVHVVQEGESLWSIAVQYFGDGYKNRQIASTNHLDDANEIIAGVELVIPE